ncbi:hypothetical protein A2Z22_00830 [Candidatus Woesebacteria bacterium RBG_16_34_12]|uniref:Glycosyltransferase 2-like domain-containing protein n=1 Tax=Candidatus Woesebacteria bacterium RBG_16_34_12 TaxID=1802480 RepID=A0A1F7X9G1_9BACT|nr:MAG: hypothetical protein A2Z22_00830 [Candidatus Woesebacteria bacterium RBG_16_34_12]
MLRKFILKHEKKVDRILEILPGFFSWNVILFPYWGIFIIPEIVAYFVLAFNIYWFYQSFLLAFTATISHFRIQASINYDWLADLKSFPDAQKVQHIVIIPTHKEPLHILTRTVNSLAKQTLPLNQIIVVIAQEKRAPIEHRKMIKENLKKEFADKFFRLIFTVHPLAAGEIIGKASNERYSAIKIKEKLIDTGKINLKYTVVTSCDSDHVFHPQHFSCLTFKFLDNPKRYEMFWQPAVLLYNNIWRLPAVTRIPNTFASIFIMSMLPRRDRLINQQNYSLSFKLLEEAGYWDPDKIPEDWGIFFKAFFKKRGKLEVEPLYLPLYADAAESTSTLKTLKVQYEQIKRWAWGVSDSPWIIKNYLITPGLSFWDKTTRLTTVIWAHFFWPVHWFIITVGLTVPTLINPRFARTALGYTVPKLSSLVLTTALVFLVVMLIFERIYRPKRPKEFPLWRAIIMPLEFVLMPVAGFFFSALPGLDAHTRLMLGKYLEYKVTEKV